MTTMMKAFTKFNYLQKILAIIMILLGIPMLIFGKSVAASTMLMCGLYLLFISFQKVEDERSSRLKMSSIFISFFVAYVFKLISSELYRFHLLPMEMTEINHFIILVLSLTNIIFYYRLYFTD